MKRTTQCIYNWANEGRIRIIEIDSVKFVVDSPKAA